MKNLQLLLVFLLSVPIFVIGQNNTQIQQKTAEAKAQIARAGKLISNFDGFDFREEVGCFISKGYQKVDGFDEIQLRDSSILSVDQTDGYTTAEIEEYRYNEDSAKIIKTSLTRLYGLSGFGDHMLTNIVDSLYGYAWVDSLNDYVLVVTAHNTFEDGLIQNSEVTLWITPDFSILLSRSNFYYDDNDFLTSEASWGLNFSTFAFEPVDSTVYTNNENGVPIEELQYLWTTTSESWNFDEKRIKHYNAGGLNDTVSIYSYNDAMEWIYDERQINEFDDMDRNIYTLKQETSDNGLTFFSVERDSVVYTSNFAFNIPDYTVSQYYDNGSWVTSDKQVNTDCMTMGVSEPALLDFSAWFTGNTIFINAGNRLIREGNLRVVDINGRVLYKTHFDQLPEQINLQGVVRGMYFLAIDDGVQRGVVKLVR